MSRLLFSLLFVLLLAIAGKAQDHYSAQVDAVTNNITVYWHDVQYTTTSGYVVYWGKTSGVWIGNSGILATPMDYNSYVISPAVDASADKYYIRIERIPIAGIAEYTDFLAIRLQVSIINSGLAQLKWNTVSASQKGIYYIERKLGAGWELLNSMDYQTVPLVNDFTYNDTISEPYCSTPGVDITYRIRFVINGFSYTQSISNEVTKGPFFDNTPPADVIADTVSQYADGVTSGIVIGWTQPPGNDIKGYMIQRSEIVPPQYDSITTVPYGTNFYVDESVSACLKNYSYAVITIDKCGKKSAGTYVANYRKNIILSDFAIDGCERIAHLVWTAYHAMPGGLGGYQVFLSEAGNPFQLVANVAPTDTTYDHAGAFKSGLTYKYFVRAISLNSNASSSSCQKIGTYFGSQMPDSLVITQAGVINEAYVKVNFMLYPDNLIKKLQLERADKREGPYQVVNSMASNGFIVQNYFIYDSTADVNSQSYYYRLGYTDECAIEPMYSNDTVRTIYLESKEANPGSSLEWNPYESWNYGVDGYAVVRTVGALIDTLAMTSANDQSFFDGLSGVDILQGVCYRVIAREKPGNPQFAHAISVSNTSCVKQSPKVFVPNAFRPKGENSIFRPVTSFVAPNTFSMAVYSKWGAKIFESFNPDLGWDGRMDGSFAPLGIYFYVVHYKSLTGESFENKGTVLLLE